MNKNKILGTVLAIFIVLSIIKFFTAKVGLLADPTVKLVLKPNFTLSNSFIMKGEDTQPNREKYKGTWYFQGKYKVITADEMGFPGERLYDLLIASWWIIGSGVLIYMLANRIKCKLSRERNCS